MLEKTSSRKDENSKAEKRRKFVELAENRTINAIKAIRVIGKLGNKNAYQFDDSEGGDIRKLAEESMVLYATGTNLLPSISLYDAGEGQLAEDFPKTFCSLIFGSAEGAYKGAVEFTQGRFNMGGTGVLPFCGD